MSTAVPVENPSRRIERVRHEIQRRPVVVARVERTSPGFVRIVFAGESLAGFTSLSFDDHCKFVFEDAQGHPVMRDYTPRRIDRDARELEIEFALHEHGRAAAWARAARVGDRAVIAGPKGSMIIPVGYDWHLLAGDASALPAIARRLEELPAAARVLVLAQAADDADRRGFGTRPGLGVQWVRGDAEWLAALRELALPAGEGFVWCAGEASVMARARDLLLVERGHPREAARIAAYWKRGAEAFHEDL